MGYLILSYKVRDQSTLLSLAINMLSQRWSKRSVLYAIVRHEHPSINTAEMRGTYWTPQKIIERFHITELCYAYVQAPVNAEPSQPFPLKSTAKAIATS